LVMLKKKRKGWDDGGKMENENELTGWKN